MSTARVFLVSLHNSSLDIFLQSGGRRTTKLSFLAGKELEVAVSSIDMSSMTLDIALKLLYI